MKWLLSRSITRSDLEWADRHRQRFLIWQAASDDPRSPLAVWAWAEDSVWSLTARHRAARKKEKLIFKHERIPQESLWWFINWPSPHTCPCLPSLHTRAHTNTHTSARTCMRKMCLHGDANNGEVCHTHALTYTTHTALTYTHSHTPRIHHTHTQRN